MEHAEFITTEEVTDLIVSFALAPGGQRSLTLLRSPQYEHLIPDAERGVTVSCGINAHGADLLRTLTWKQARVEVRTERHSYVVDVSGVSDKEIAGAKSVLERMIEGWVP